MLRILPFLLSLVVASPAAFAGIELDSHYSDNLVLQQNKMTRIHGRASPGVEVKLSFSGIEQTTQSAMESIHSR